MNMVSREGACPFRYNGIRKGQALSLLFIVLVIMAMSCGKTEGIKQNKDIDFEALDFDFMQQTIYDVISVNYQFKGVPFITYQVLGTDSDRNYNRYYVQAMIDDIDSKLNVITSVVYPFAFTFDKDTEKLVRYYYPDPDDKFSYEELRNNFPAEVLREYLSIPQEANIELMEKFSATNMWNAGSYFGE